MNQAEIREYDDPDALADDVAERLLVLITDVQSSGRTPQICLTGGTIAAAIHSAVARAAPSSRVDWRNVAFWWGDERFVAPDSPDRNAGQARLAMLDALDVDPARVHEMPSTADAASIDQAAATYSDTVREHGSDEFDLVMLGIGPDGHVASLFPGYPQLEVSDQIAVGVSDSPKPPPGRVTLTFPALNRTRAVWLVASGQGKAEAVQRAIGGPGGDPHATPARGVRGRQETVWFLDSAAASLL